jgi:hypothetical protein
VDPLEIKARLNEAKELLAEARISVHAVLDRIDGTTIYGPNNVVMFRLQLGKVKPETVEGN